MKSHATQRVVRNTSSAEEAGLHRKGECGKAGSCSCMEGSSSHHPCGAHFKGEKTSCFGSCSACPPCWSSCSHPYSFPDTKPLSSSGTKLPRNWDSHAVACVTAQGCLKGSSLGIEEISEEPWVWCSHWLGKSWAFLKTSLNIIHILTHMHKLGLPALISQFSTKTGRCFILVFVHLVLIDT